MDGVGGVIASEAVGSQSQLVESPATKTVMEAGAAATPRPWSAGAVPSKRRLRILPGAEYVLCFSVRTLTVNVYEKNIPAAVSVGCSSMRSNSACTRVVA